MKILNKISIGLLMITMGWPSAVRSQANEDVIKLINQRFEAVGHRLDAISKAVDDLAWYNKVGELAYIDKVFITGPPPAVVKNPTAKGAANPVRFYTYIFIPRNIDPAKKYPLLVLPHGGVHADFDTYYTHIIREMMTQQYIVVAPEYRGSTGYGQRFYELIDYGGLENEDAKASRDYVVENYEFADPKRVGIIGWSHGGMIALMNIFNYPDDYQVAFAGVPVSDLVARMGYATDSYRKLFSADYHIGKTAAENVEEYRRRSPVNHAHKLQTPLLIHTNTNDDDVYVLEVEHLIRALKAEGKKFEYEIYKDIPGGHGFDRSDTKFAKETRVKIYDFMARYLSPPRPIKNLRDIDKAAYRPLGFGTK
ncbi:MAG: prolyl oligopeptidase family serine peptidase [Bacteroidales bacterium]|nr:prolyl oligopeptidase family serine peptidase [Bacteroidales bacterium]MDZ4204844.1 prolyl oligopeptidase family serine peptidase [Bacteroidales bacterium]